MMLCYCKEAQQRVVLQSTENSNMTGEQLSHYNPSSSPFLDVPVSSPPNIDEIVGCFIFPRQSSQVGQSGGDCPTTACLDQRGLRRMEWLRGGKYVPDVNSDSSLP